jgi:signal transduction histidine kinase
VRRGARRYRRGMALVSGLWARARGLDPRAVDLLVALILGVIIVVQEAAMVRPGAIEVLAGAGSAATVAWRRRAPVAATIAAAACIGLLARSSGAPNPELVVLVLNFYMLGRRGSGERAWLSLEVLLVAVALPAVALVPGSFGVIDVVSTWAVFIVLPFAGARVIGSRTAAVHELQSDAQRLESEQREHARRAINEERIRIARELHDVIAHSVSVMVIQTAAARRLARQDHDAAGEALDAVANCGREALSEMRRMVGVLHRGHLDLAGAPGLMQLQVLVDRARASGLPVEVRIDGDPRPLPQMIDLVAFRVVQEALTNVIKHAGDARAEVKVDYTTRTLDIDVIDDGRGPVRPDPGLGGTGHGLIGMRERLATYGGELQTGRGRGGGFRVRARIPLTEARSA